MNLNTTILASGIDLKPHRVEGSSFLTNTMITAFIVAAAIIIFCIIVRIFFIPKWRSDVTKISPLQTFLEWFIGSVVNNANDHIHDDNFISDLYPVLTGYIFIGILTEFLGLRSPLSDLNMTLILGLITFCLVHYYGFYKRKLTRFKHYANPIMWISDFVVPLSIGLRLFGNVFSGYAIMHLIHSMPWIWVRVLLTLPSLFIFTAFHALIQSYVYMVLSINFIGEAVD